MSEPLPTPEDLARLSAATIDELTAGTAAREDRAQAVIEVSDATARKVVDDGQDIERARLRQANRLRTFFFWWIAAAMAFSLLASVGIMGFYVWFQRGSIHPGVMIAWMSATVVETLGLAYIVANYLFPTRGEPRPSR